MSYILEIPETTRCRYCKIVVEFMDTWNCPILKESVGGSSYCKAGLDSDQSFVEGHIICKKLYEEKSKLEDKIESMEEK